MKREARYDQVLGDIEFLQVGIQSFTQSTIPLDLFSYVETECMNAGRLQSLNESEGSRRPNWFELRGRKALRGEKAYFACLLPLINYGCPMSCVCLMRTRRVTAKRFRGESCEVSTLSLLDHSSTVAQRLQGTSETSLHLERTSSTPITNPFRLPLNFINFVDPSPNSASRIASRAER